MVVAAIGSEWRGDDGVGPEVLRRARARCPEALLERCLFVGPLAGPLDLLGQWDEADLAIVVDATRSGLAPGTVTRLELGGDATGADGPPSRSGRSHAADPDAAASSHGIGLAAVARLARAVERAPARTVVVGVEGERFDRGAGLSPAVTAALDAATAAVTELLEEAGGCA